MAKSQEQTAQPTRNKFDGFVYWVSQIFLAVLAVSGTMYYLQPVDLFIRAAFAFAVVGSMLYIALRNR